MHITTTTNIARVHDDQKFSIQQLSCYSLSTLLNKHITILNSISALKNAFVRQLIQAFASAFAYTTLVSQQQKFIKPQRGKDACLLCAAHFENFCEYRST